MKTTNIQVIQLFIKQDPTQTVFGPSQWDNSGSDPLPDIISFSEELIITSLLNTGCSWIITSRIVSRFLHFSYLLHIVLSAIGRTRKSSIGHNCFWMISAGTFNKITVTTKCPGCERTSSADQIILAVSINQHSELQITWASERMGVLDISCSARWSQGRSSATYRVLRNGSCVSTKPVYAPVTEVLRTFSLCDKSHNTDACSTDIWFQSFLIWKRCSTSFIIQICGVVSH